MRKKNKRNYLLAFLFSIVSWIVFTITILYIEPGQGWWAYVLLFSSLFFALFLTLSLLFGHTRRGLTISILTVGVLLLRLFEMDNIVNLVLVIALFTTVEIFFWQR